MLQKHPVPTFVADVLGVLIWGDGREVSWVLDMLVFGLTVLQGRGRAAARSTQIRSDIMVVVVVAMIVVRKSVIGVGLCSGHERDVGRRRRPNLNFHERSSHVH